MRLWRFAVLAAALLLRERLRHRQRRAALPSSPSGRARARFGSASARQRITIRKVPIEKYVAATILVGVRSRRPTIRPSPSGCSRSRRSSRGRTRSRTSAVTRTKASTSARPRTASSIEPARLQTSRWAAAVGRSRARNDRRAALVPRLASGSALPRRLRRPHQPRRASGAAPAIRISPAQTTTARRRRARRRGRYRDAEAALIGGAQRRSAHRASARLVRGIQIAGSRRGGPRGARHHARRARASSSAAKCSAKSCPQAFGVKAHPQYAASTCQRQRPVISSSKDQGSATASGLCQAGALARAPRRGEIAGRASHVLPGHQARHACEPAHDRDRASRDRQPTRITTSSHRRRC